MPEILERFLSYSDNHSDALQVAFKEFGKVETQDVCQSFFHI
jgi:hypothetical protein